MNLSWCFTQRFAGAALTLLLLSGCGTLPTRLPEDLLITAKQIESGDTAASEQFVSAVENRISEYERDGEWYQAVQLTAEGLRLLPDHPRLVELYQSSEAQLETARLYLGWERLIGETRQQLTERDLLRSENKLKAPSDYRDWQLNRLEQAIDTSAEKLRQCGLQSMESRQWHYAEDCLLLAAHIRGHDFVKQEQAELKQSRDSTAPASKTINTLQERRLATAFNQALQQNNLLKARATLQRLQQLDTVQTNLPALENQLNTAIAKEVIRLEEQAAEHYRNQEYQRAKENWQAILSLQPSHEAAKERLKRAEKVLQTLEELQSETDKPAVAEDAK